MMMVTITICPIMIPAFAKDPTMFCDTVEVAVSLYTVYVDCVGLFCIFQYKKKLVGIVQNEVEKPQQEGAELKLHTCNHCQP